MDAAARAESGLVALRRQRKRGNEPPSCGGLDDALIGEGHLDKVAGCASNRRSVYPLQKGANHATVWKHFFVIQETS
jgi:hypothetical protein